MKLSIVVPALDEAARLGATLDALAPLRRAGHEVIVVDGGSRDATASVAASRADRVLTAPRGRAVQMNVGAAVAAGDALFFLHADCRPPPDADRRIADALGRGRRWGRFDVALDGRSAMLPWVAAAMNRRSAVSGICTGDQGIFVDRALFEAVGGFPPIALMEDVALSRVLLRAGGRPARVADRMFVSGRRWDEYGAWRTIGTMWALRFAYWRGADPAGLARRYYGAEAARAPTLQVFAKAPLPGRVKTRLAHTMGHAAATEAYRSLALHSLAAAASARRAGVVGALELWVAPDASGDEIAQWACRFGATMRTQHGGDLGSRMQHALRSSLEHGVPALLIGTDVPGYDVAYIAAAAAALQSHDAVFGPAEDGGYVLVGLARDVDAFEGIPWSSGGVMTATRERLMARGVRWQELPPLWDVDTHDDYVRWKGARPRDGALNSVALPDTLPNAG